MLKLSNTKQQNGRVETHNKQTTETTTKQDKETSVSCVEICYIVKIGKTDNSLLDAYSSFRGIELQSTAGIG